MPPDAQDNYRVLGLTRDATSQDIKRAFRKLAKEHHPDKKGSNEKFLRIKSAYEALLKESSNDFWVQPQQTSNLKGFERRAKAEGCRICHGLGYQTVNTNPSQGFLGLEEIDCICQNPTVDPSSRT
jgi:hypothetical protein